MLDLTYLKETDKVNEKGIVSFEGDIADINHVIDYVNISNSVEDDYYRGFKRGNDGDCEYGYGEEELCDIVSDIMEEEEEEDIVNHPHHYAENGAMECIDEMILLYGEEAVMNFCLCNMHKYRYRANMKGGAVDKQKSDWYVAKYKELKDIIQKKKIAKHDKFVMDMRTLLKDGASLYLNEPEFTGQYKELFPFN